MRAASWLIGLTLVSGVAVGHADVVGGDTLTRAGHPDGGQLDGSLSVWLARRRGMLYVGGEIAVETHTQGEGDFALSYHALIGIQRSLQPDLLLLVDAGLGPSQRLAFNGGVLANDPSIDTVGWVASGAVRSQLIMVLTTYRESDLGLGLIAEARSDVWLESYGYGLGISFYAGNQASAKTGGQ